MTAMEQAKKCAEDLDMTDNEYSIAIIAKHMDAFAREQIRELLKDKERLDWVIEWLGFNEDVSKMPCRDWVDKDDARKAFDEALDNAKAER